MLMVLNCVKDRLGQEREGLRGGSISNGLEQNFFFLCIIRNFNLL